MGEYSVHLPLCSGFFHNKKQKPHWGNNRVTRIHVWSWTGIFNHNLTFRFCLLMNCLCTCRGEMFCHKGCIESQTRGAFVWSALIVSFLFLIFLTVIGYFSNFRLRCLLVACNHVTVGYSKHNAPLTAKFPARASALSVIMTKALVRPVCLQLLMDWKTINSAMHSRALMLYAFTSGVSVSVMDVVCVCLWCWIVIFVLTYIPLCLKKFHFIQLNVFFCLDLKTIYGFVFVRNVLQ